jgi:hypothetical protein
MNLENAIDLSRLTPVIGGELHIFDEIERSKLR